LSIIIQVQIKVTTSSYEISQELKSLHQVYTDIIDYKQGMVYYTAESIAHKCCGRWI